MGRTSSGYAREESAGATTLALRTVPPSPSMSTKRVVGAAVEPDAAWAAGARPRAVPATRVAETAPTALVRSALVVRDVVPCGCLTGRSSLVSVQSDPTVTGHPYRK